MILRYIVLECCILYLLYIMYILYIISLHFLLCFICSISYVVFKIAYCSVVCCMNQIMSDDIVCAILYCIVFYSTLLF